MLRFLNKGYTGYFYVSFVRFVLLDFQLLFWYCCWTVIGWRVGPELEVEVTRPNKEWYTV